MPPAPADTPAETPAGPVAVTAPSPRRSCALVFASPHSGRDYSADLTRWTRIDRTLLRRSEDAFVDELFAEAPRHGAPLVAARFPRVFVDVNRARDELDGAMFDPPLPMDNRSGSRAAAGLGVIPRLAADGRRLYETRLPADEARRRLEAYYAPYHAAVRAQLDAASQAFGEAFLIDCHSMPSASARGADIVLGDRYGASCSRALIARAEAVFRDQGFAVVRNRPYAGAFTTEHYGRPGQGVEALQIEINRGLYLDEAKVERSRGFGALKRAIGDWMAAMASPGDRVRQAAE